MTTKMRAALLETPGTVEMVDDIEINDPRAGEVLVRVSHCGLCHSDLSVVDGSFPGALPVVLGHEAAGIVEAIGPGSPPSRVGDPVVLTPLPNCGRCYFCVRHEPTLCQVHSIALFTGLLPDGTTPLSRNGQTGVPGPRHRRLRGAGPDARGRCREGRPGRPPRGGLRPRLRRADRRRRRAQHRQGRGGRHRPRARRRAASGWPSRRAPASPAPR